jgi:lysozyme family protein
MPTFASLRVEYRTLWKSMTLRPSKIGAIDAIAKRILANKERYVEVSKKTGVPWFLIAGLHYRESNLNFKKHLHEGSSLNDRTKKIPKGHPKAGNPPFTWEESAYDALVNLKGLNKIKDWSIERIIYEVERYNGFGYRNNKYPLSPYVWNGSTHYTKGKYVDDGVYNRNHVDSQLGVIAILKRLDEMDGTFDLEHANAPVLETVAESKSLVAIITGGLIWAATQLTDALQNSWDAIGAMFAALPHLVSMTQEQIAPTEQVVGWLGFDWSTIGKYAIIATLLLVAYRHFKDKQAMEKAEVTTTKKKKTKTKTKKTEA